MQICVNLCNLQVNSCKFIINEVRNKVMWPKYHDVRPKTFRIFFSAPQESKKFGHPGINLPSVFYFDRCYFQRFIVTLHLLLYRKTNLTKLQFRAVLTQKKVTTLKSKTHSVNFYHFVQPDIFIMLMNNMRFNDMLWL